MINKEKILEYMSEDSYNNLFNNFDQFVIICVENETDDTCYGKILGVHYNDKVESYKRKKELILDLNVQFKKHRSKWNYNNLFVVHPYYVTKHSKNLKLSVPINIFDSTSSEFKIEQMELTKAQYIKRKLKDYYIRNDIPYYKINALENFEHINAKSHDYNYAIQSTVKHCYISEQELKSFRGIVSNQKKRIYNEWNKYVEKYCEELQQ